MFPLASNYIRGHAKQLATHAGNFQQRLLKRSLFALAAVYNKLPQDVVDLDDISLFQGALTDFAKYGCSNGRPYWQYTFDPDPDTSNFTLILGYLFVLAIGRKIMVIYLGVFPMVS